MVRRKRGAIASEADVPFLAPIVAVENYHPLPALLCRLLPARARGLAEQAAWHSSPLSEVPREGASREDGDHCRKVERRNRPAIMPLGARRLGQPAAFADAMSNTMSQPPSAARQP